MSEETSTLAERAKSYAADQRAQAVAKYRSLLLRNEPKDAEAIIGIMAALGRDPGHLHDDVELVQQLDAHERLVKSTEKLQGKLVRKHAVLSKALRETEQAREELERSTAAKIRPLESARDQAQMDLNTAKHARLDLASMQDAWAAIEQGISIDELRAARRKAQAAVTPPALHGPSVPQDK
jgi:hypothetical protein